jgi:hypothetical protein
VLQEIASLYQKYSSLLESFTKEQVEVSLDFYSSLAQTILALADRYAIID